MNKTEDNAALLELVKAADLDVLMIGGKGHGLSKRKAKKLANRYRGSRRGKIYSQYLAGTLVGYVTHNNRLVPLPDSGAATFTTIHSDQVYGIVAGKGTTSTYSVENPAETVL